MWLKFAQENNKDFSSPFGMPWREVGEAELLEHQKHFPWMEEYYAQDGTEIPHESDYHQESLIEHIRMVPQQIKNLGQYKDNPLVADLLGVAGILHDHWKIRSREPKIKYRCQNCKSLATNPNTPCANCGGEKDQNPTTLMGYHGHEEAGARDQNLFPLLSQMGMPKQYWPQVQLLIRHHLTMHEILQTIQDEQPISEKALQKWKKIFDSNTGFEMKDKIRMAVVLAIGDDLGRRSSKSVRIQEIIQNQSQENITKIIDEIVDKILAELSKEKEVSQNKNSNDISDETLRKIVDFLASQDLNLDISNNKGQILNALKSIGRQDLIPQIIEIIRK